MSAGLPLPAFPRTGSPTFAVASADAGMHEEDMGQSAEFGKFLKAMRSRLTLEQAGIGTPSGARGSPGCGAKRSRGWPMSAR